MSEPSAPGQGDGAGPAHGQLSLWDTVSIIVGIVIGSSIFTIPTIIFIRTSGPWEALGMWLIGGVLSEIHWQAIFWVGVPIGIIGTIWSVRSLKELGVRSPGRVDWAGTVTVRPSRWSVSSTARGSIRLKGSQTDFNGWGPERAARCSRLTRRASSRMIGCCRGRRYGSDWSSSRFCHRRLSRPSMFWCRTYSRKAASEKAVAITGLSATTPPTLTGGHVRNGNGGAILVDNPRNVLTLSYVNVVGNSTIQVNRLRRGAKGNGGGDLFERYGDARSHQRVWQQR